MPKTPKARTETYTTSTPDGTEVRITRDLDTGKQTTEVIGSAGIRTDVGVPMQPNDGSGPVGPEDALDPGPKRGDYTGRTGGGNSHQVVPDPNAKPGEPQVIAVAQGDTATPAA